MSYDRLTSENAAVLLVDHQTGLSNGVQDQSVPEYLIAVTALDTITRNFKLPCVISTNAADGPNGPIMPIIREILPDAPIVHRPGEINAWDNADFAAAVKKSRMFRAGRPVLQRTGPLLTNQRASHTVSPRKSAVPSRSLRKPSPTCIESSKRSARLETLS
jgi:hypothetical protein